MPGSVHSELPEVLRKFTDMGVYKSAAPYGMGHINDTFKVSFEDQQGCLKSCIVQRINHHVFKQPVQVMENIEQVTSHLRTKITEMGGDPMRESLTLLNTEDGRNWVQTSAGNYWRGYWFIDGACSYQIPEKSEHVYNAGLAFGNFIGLLDDFPTTRLAETIPGFHNTRQRYATFLQTMKTDAHNRAAQVKTEIDFLLDRAQDMPVLVQGLEQGVLPERVTHNDTKFNNVMLDVETGKAICVVDLDTVMPGLALYDYGDAIRSITNTGEEDEPDLTKVHFNLDSFRIFTDGYAAATRKILTEKEIELLPFSAKLITMEIGMRFLTDHLDGDNYFKIHHPGHNLDRCRTQFRLVAEMEAQMDVMAEIVNSFYRA